MESARGGRIGRALALALVLVASSSASSQVLQDAPALPGRNINAIGPTPPNWLLPGNPRMQHNEADGVFSPVNPDWCAIGMNDYRAVNEPSIGDSFPGVAFSRDGCNTFISGLHPAHLADTPSINQKFGADPNLEAVPYMMFYNFIAGWRDDSQPGGIYMSRWYEHNRELGPPWEYLDTRQIIGGTKQKFLDKPAFEAFYHAPGTPDILVPIPAFTDPRNPANSHAAYTLSVPAVRLHMCYAIFLGNDNNDGTSINCLASDDGGITWPIKTKLTESVGINQGISIASRNYGQEILYTWLRFEDNNENSAIMYAMSFDGGNSATQPKVVTEFCPFNQGTGPARFRTNALPVAASNGNDFAVYFASRNDADGPCIIPAKGNQDPIIKMSPVAPQDDFDAFGEPEPVLVDGVLTRQRDNQVRTAYNYSRIMMIRGTPSGNGMRWDSRAVAIDPQETTTVVNGETVTARRASHQYRPAVGVAQGIETVAWKDSRLDRLNLLSSPITSGYVEDVVVHLEAPLDGDGNPLPAPPWESARLLPAGIYELEPPPPGIPPAVNNFALRRNVDMFAAQIALDDVSGEYTPRTYFVDDDFYPVGAAGTASPSVRVTRYAQRIKRRVDRSDPANPVLVPVIDPETGRPVIEQAEYHFPNARLFVKGTRPFTGDYETVFAIEGRQNPLGQWVSNQAPVTPADYFSSATPRFQVAWTTNKDVRGKVFYTGCDEWDETLQMWVASDNCGSEYVDPNPPTPGMLAPLQGEDGAEGAPILSCSASGLDLFNIASSNKGPLTRNQNIYTAAMKPGLYADILSAVKDRDSGSGVTGANTFVIGLHNGSAGERLVRLVLLNGDQYISFDKNTLGDPPPANELTSINVRVPANSTNVRTAFDIGDTSLPDGIVEVYDITGLAPSSPGALVARLPLARSSVLPLESVFTNDEDPVDVLEFESYEINLFREFGVDKLLDFENIDYEKLDFENAFKLLDMENSAEMLDFENLDFENTVIFLDYENIALMLDFENVGQLLDFENQLITNLDFENSTYSLLDFENLDFENIPTLLDFENLDFENQTMFLDFENLDFENRFLEALDFENADYEALDFENLDFENAAIFFVDVAALDFENEALLLDFENRATLASTVKNQDLANLDFENTALGEESVQITFSAESDGNTTTGVDIKPIFSPALIAALNDPDNSDPATGESRTKVLLTVRQVYYTSTVSLAAQALSSQFCTPQVVAQNQVVYSAILGADEITPFFDDPDPSNPDTPGFVLDPDARKFITIEFINPPDDFDTSIAINPHVGLGVYGQPIGGTVACAEEIEAEGENFEACDIQVPVGDEDAPVITILGDNPLEVEATQDPDAEYTDPGALALDNVDGDVTAAIITMGNVDLATLGEYSITYTVYDEAGNEATATRTVRVVDTTPPVIFAPADVTTEALAPLTAVTLGDATASDNSGSVTVTNDAATNYPSGFPVGISAVTWTASDGTQSSTATQSVIVTDLTAPSVMLNPLVVDDGAGGSLSLIDYDLEVGEPYVELGAMVADLADPSPLLVISGGVDTTAVGVYVITYTATDATATNADGTPAAVPNSTTVTRTITVVDTTAPTIIGDIPPPLVPDPATVLIVPPATTWTISWPINASDPGAPPTLACTIDGTTTIQPTSSSYDSATGVLEATFDYGFPAGTSVVECTATDQGGNSATTGPFEVFVEDQPEIDPTTVPTSPFVIDGNTSTGYSGPPPWPPVLATDGVDGSIEAVCTPVTDLPFGDTEVTCEATDSAGNVSEPVSFTAHVRFAFDIAILGLNGNKTAGSVIPVDWYYTEPGTNIRVDSSDFMPMVAWFGPFANRSGCSTDATGSSDGSVAADDAGQSSIRYSASDRSWRLNWDTPRERGYYRLVITPPGNESGTECVSLR